MKPGERDIIIRTVCRLLVPFVQLFGLYVIMHGHSSPGGGFQGGVIIASSFILLAMGDGYDEVKRRFSLGALTATTSAGVRARGGAALQEARLAFDAMVHIHLSLHGQQG